MGTTERLARETLTVPTGADVPGGLDALHGGLARFWAGADGTPGAPPDGRWRLEFGTALAEIVANVLKHAAPPRPVRVSFDLFADRVEARIDDDGLPYSPGPAPHRAPPDPDDPLSLPEGGYGLAIARAALDELRYERREDGTNSWRLVKTWPAVVP